ncbi:MAG: hypothetical protein J0H30_11365 [Alphaproteobacteria bacterium]|jgi:hypothetical protein|nr:hypothetical protein [Alphaproteobacteria bacterium]MBN9566789.1 hypothetical protein [Alphaproteobacteria bacterium]MBN9571614.1 hypothetical protein [Alphaproteobacteria bacterium]MBN9591505.1 hypothetical protein [Alphaproteobacteria bacterium]OJU57666.1 MAG: hypothetical protein BGO00_11070 [Alphaproteobacteria bacterium 62-8]
MRILQYISVALAAIDVIAKAGGSVSALIANIETTIRAMQAENRDPTVSEWKAMNEQIVTAIDALD